MPSHILPSLHLSIAVILVISHAPQFASSQLAELPSHGCRYQQVERSFHCSNTTLEKVVSAVRIFASIFNQTVKPLSIDIKDSHFPELPFFLGQFNESLVSFRLVRSRLEYIYPDAFARLDKTLRTLDLSQNRLYSVPYAIGTLRNLEFLNLSSNAISLLRPSPSFKNLQKLRVLDLSRNYLGLDPVHVGDPSTVPEDEEVQRRLSANLTLQEFSLEPAVDVLEVLLLNDNKLVAVPAQLYKRAFPRLQTLNLDANLLTSLPDFSSTLLPSLRTLSFRNNYLETIPFYCVPSAKDVIDFSGNPLRCDCSALWLQEWQSYNLTRAVLPTCTAPEEFRNQPLISISPHQMCWHANQTKLFKYVVKGFENHALLALTSSGSSISVTWSVSNQGHKWVLLYRKDTTSPYQMTLHPRGNEGIHTSGDGPEAVYTDIIGNLDQDTLYMVCVAINKNNQYIMEAKKCQRVRTKKHIPQVVATGSVVSIQLQVTSPPPYQKKSKTILLAMKPSSGSVTLRWKVTVNKSKRATRAKIIEEAPLPKEWIILVRRFATQNYTEIRITDSSGESRSNSTYSYTVPQLQPSTAYDLCLVALDSYLEDNLTSMAGYTKQVPPYLVESLRQRAAQQEMTCKEVVTKPEPQAYSARSIALATGVSTTTTAVIVAVICCCFPRKTFRNCFRKVKTKVSDKRDSSYHSSETSVKMLVTPQNSVHHNGGFIHHEDTAPEPIPKQIAAIRTRSKSLPSVPPEFLTPTPPNPPPPAPANPQLLYSPWEDINRKAPRRSKSEYYSSTLLHPFPPKTPPPRPVGDTTKSSDSYITPVGAFPWGQGYLNTKGIHYIGGKKVQVFVHGSKTLPRNCLRRPQTPHHKENGLFHSRYNSLSKKARAKFGVGPEHKPSASPKRTGSRASQKLCFSTFGKGPQDDSGCTSSESGKNSPKPLRSNGELNGILKSDPSSQVSSECTVFIEHV